jgi:hypothetical protein
VQISRHEAEVLRRLCAHDIYLCILENEKNLVLLELYSDDRDVSVPSRRLRVVVNHDKQSTNNSAVVVSSLRVAAIKLPANGCSAHAPNHFLAMVVSDLLTYSAELPDI